MKRRKFLQILGLAAAAPTAVLACPPVARPWPKPDKKHLDKFKEYCYKDVKLTRILYKDEEPNRVQLEIRPYLTDEDYDSVRIYPVESPHELTFPDKPIFPNYLRTNA